MSLLGYVVLAVVIRSFDNENPFFPGVHAIFYFFFQIELFVALLKRKATINDLPVELMKKQKINLIFEYADYVNNKIEDDEPHLNINQDLYVKIKEVPRTAVEKNVVEIKNNNIIDRPALVAKISDEHLAEQLRENYKLNAKLISIHEFAQLEIQLSLELKTNEAENESQQTI